MQRENVIVKSKQVSPDLLRNELGKLSDDTEGIFISKDYLARSSESHDPDSFSCEFSSAFPVDLTNFSNRYPEQLIMFDKISPVLSRTEISEELTVLNSEVNKWREGGFNIRGSFKMVDNPKGVSLNILESSSGQWRLRWPALNKKTFFERNNFESRLEMANSFLAQLTKHLNLAPVKVKGDNEFLVPAQEPHPRILIYDTGAILEESIERMSFELNFSGEEFEPLVKGLALFFDQFKIEGRVQVNLSQPRDQYQKWLQSFDFRPSCYAYMVESFVNNEAIDFFRNESDVPPVGFVPLAHFKVSADEKSLGYLDLSCIFDKEGSACFNLSARTLECMNHFINVTGLEKLLGKNNFIYS